MEYFIFYVKGFMFIYFTNSSDVVRMRVFFNDFNEN